MMNLSFAGCGFLGIYHVGVAVCFKKYAPHLLLHRISGASAGALAATCLLCDMPLGEMTSDFFRVVNEARSHSLGPFSPSFNIQTCLLEGLQKFLPPNAHEMVSGKLHVSLTRVYDGKNVIVSQFNSREDLLQALLCACFIPGFSGILPPRFHGVRYMDGAFSDNLPILDENTVTVSPFCGESDICPRDQSAQLFHVNWANTSIELSKQNMNRFARILFPPKAEILSKMCQQGFDDALQFLHRNNLISCTRCLAVQSTFIIQETVPEPQPDFDPECTECKKHRKDALVADMPETVLTVFQTYIEAANKGLANWIFKRRGVKLLQTLSLPATLPADFVYATLSRLLLAAPAIGSQLWSLSKFILTQLNEIIIQRNKNEKMAGNLSCKIRMNEYGTHQVSRSAQVDIIMSKNTSVAIPPTYKSTTDISQSTSSSSDMVPANQLSSMPIPHDCDAFEHILQVTMHQDAVYAYYYMDENNKVKVTEIFDMSESSDATLQTTNERDVNTQLQFDNDWNLSEPDCMFLGNEDSIYNAIDNQQHNNSDLTIDLQDLGEFYDIFHSNAETAAILDRDEAWTGIQIEEVPSDPESDQHHYSQLSESASNALNRSLTQTYQYTNN